jgi:type I restriction enzyme S subunit
MSIAATVGRPIITGFDTCIHDGFVSFEKIDGIDRELLFHILKGIEHEWSSSGQTGSQSNVNTTIVSRREVAFPTNRREQKKISSALSDADELIDGINRLITKKQAIKQGMMQELLTGRTRFPGFTEMWSRGRTLAELCQRSSGYWGSDQPTSESDVRVRIIRAGDISAEGLLVGWIDRYLRQEEWKKAACRADDVVITASGNGLGKTYYVHDVNRLAASNFVKILRPRTGVSGEYIRYLLQSGPAQRKLVEHTATSAYPNLLPSFYTDPWCDLPPLAEQIAIGQALRSVDHVVDCLKVQLNKARAIKQGMMQELLTGRTRLPVEEVVA